MANSKAGNPHKSNSLDQTKRPVLSNSEMNNVVSKDNFKEQFKKWITFFKLNYDMFATFYLQLDLFLYQKIVLHLMGRSNLAVIIASRGISKSFMIGIFACCKCILEPNSIVVIASATRNQAMLILKEKIQNELCKMSPNLAKEIKSIKTSQNDGIVEFHNGSRIIICTANENSRGYRSNCNIYEEARMIPENVLNSVLSPFLISRQAPYLKKEEYKHLSQEPVEIYISSAWFKSLEWFWKLIKTTGEGMLEGKESVLQAYDYPLAIHHNLKTAKQMEKEKEKSDDVSFAIEYENCMFDSEGSFFTYDLFKNARTLKKAVYPMFPEEYVANKKRPSRLQKKEGVIRLLSCDIAMSNASDSDNSIYTMAELIPMKGYYSRKISYTESHNGKTAMEQATRIRRLVHEFDIDVLIIDCMTIGLPVLDLLGTTLIDNETGEEYSPLCAYNDEELKARCRVQNARPMIFGMKASLQLNSEMIVDMKTVFQQNKVELLVSEGDAENFLTATNKAYANSDSPQFKALYELPYIQQTLCVNECIQLETEFRQGKIAMKERRGGRKDRFSSLLYLLWVATLMEKENFVEDEYDSDEQYVFF